MPDRRTPVARAGLLAIAVVAAFTSACTTSGGSSTGSKGYITGEGVVTTLAVEDRHDAPELRGEQLGGGDEIALADYAGSVVVINVWASWCSPCRAEAADLIQVADDRPDVEFLGLNVRDQESAAEAFVREKGIPYPSLVSQDGALMLEFYGLLNLASIPSTIVVDAEGRIAALVLGQVDASTLDGLVSDVGRES
jgi:thiol-disulfide isomerase/thioredoxin